MQTSSRSAPKQMRTIETSVQAERSTRRKEISAQNSNHERAPESSLEGGAIKRKKAEVTASPDQKQGPRTWLRGFNELRAYKKKHGTVDVKSSDPAGSFLMEWIAQQRQDHHHGTLADDHRDKLRDLGFKFTLMSYKNIQDWRRILQIFKDYKKKYSTCMIPSRYHFGGVKLGRWVCRQRCQSREGKLNPEQWEALDSMGFIWDLKTPQAESEKALMPETSAPQAQATRVRVVSPDASMNAQSYLKSSKNVKRALEKSLRREERKKKKPHKSKYSPPGQIVNYATMNVAINKPLQEEREEAPSKKLSSKIITEEISENDPGSLSGSGAVAVEPATRKSSRKRALPQKFVDDILFTEDQDLSDLEIEAGLDEEDTDNDHEDYSSDGDSIRRASDSEGGMFKYQYPAPLKHRNLWQDMYDHDHQWHANAKDPTAHKDHTVHDDGDQDEEPTSWRDWPPLHDEYSTWQAVDTQAIQWKKQNQEGAGWQEMHAQNKGWKDYYAKLVKFCLMHGHCSVPPEKNTGNISEPSLYVWVSTQRRLYRTKRLCAERTSLLKQIGFAWTASASDKVVRKGNTNATAVKTKEATKPTPPPPIIAPFSPDIQGRPRKQYFSPEKYDRESLW